MHTSKMYNLPCFSHKNTINSSKIPLYTYINKELIKLWESSKHFWMQTVLQLFGMFSGKITFNLMVIWSFDTICMNIFIFFMIKKLIGKKRSIQPKNDTMIFLCIIFQRLIITQYFLHRVIFD